MTNVMPSPKIGFEHETGSHRICSQLSDVDRRLDRTSELQLVGLNGNDLHQRHWLDEYLRLLVVQTIVYGIPSCAFNVETLEVSALLQSLSDFAGIMDLGDVGVHAALVQGPSFGSASGLDESCAVRLGNGQA